MDTTNWTFLTHGEALDAVALDFQEYGLQPRLFQELARLLGCKENIAPGETEPMENLPFLLLHLLETLDLSPPQKTQIFTRIFETRVRVTADGIWIRDQMDEFHCAMCGECCRNLFYETDCTREDLRLWEETGRTDILERVMVTQTRQGKTEYRIWMDPSSGTISDQCPWLDWDKKQNMARCAIQDVKPDICRQYPFTRKHACMTDCRGDFYPAAGKNSLKEMDENQFRSARISRV